MISAAARSGVSLDDIVDQLMSTGACPSYAKRGKSKGSCCPMAVGNALLDMYNEIQKELNNDNSSITNDEEKSSILCPTCGEKLVFEGGCNICKACGWSKCD